MSCARNKSRRVKRGIGGSIASGALSGAGSGASFGPWGMAAGAVVGGAMGFFKGKKQEEAEQFAKKQTALTTEAGDYMADLNMLQAYNNQFNAAYGTNMAANGLNMQAEFAPGQVASDVYRMEGPDHEQGGIDVDANGDGYAEYELEGGEIVEGTRVYSKRLKAPQAFVDMAKDEGFSIKRGTYSSVAESLGRQKEKYEDKLDSFDQSTANTGELMLERIDNLFNQLFYTQEFAKLKRTS